MYTETAAVSAPAPRPLAATYRLQLGAECTLAHVRAIAPYLERLGISHVYSSPILMARRGSTHGYDVADPTRLDPVLGDRADLRATVEDLHARNMGWVLDIVPNHMGIGRDNPFWNDVLRHGRASAYAHWFDIDWDPIRRPMRGRVLLPMLGDRLERVLARGELSLVCEDNQLRVAYFERRFPLTPESEGELLAAADGDPARAARQFAESDPDRARLRALLRRQVYRLAFWRRAEREINYRRFFNINELVALRMEDADVFAAMHALVLHWVADGLLDGLRVDHVDGLADPRGYLDRLRAAVERAGGSSSFPILVEKILAPGEPLPRAWPVQGTTGYDFLNQLESVFVHPDGFARIESAYRRRTRTRATFREIAIRAKLLVLRHSLLADVRRLQRLLGPLAAGTGGLAARRAELMHAVETVIACLPVYRTYIDARSEPRPADREALHAAAHDARSRRAAPDAAIAWLTDLFLEPKPDPERLRFITRFQQTSGPAAAKGVEDTALYRYVPLASLNEVGGEPARALDHAVHDLHAACAARAREWPGTLLAATTHDTKRSADTRARLDVLSEIPDRWLRQLATWRRAHRRFRTVVERRAVPDAAAEHLFYQTVVGIWPAGFATTPAMLSDTQHAALVERTRDYMRKATREAKVHTSWRQLNAPWEEALDRFIGALLGQPGSPFARDVAQLVSEIAPAGMRNALARVVVQSTSPGVPDLYQGDELWNFSLVDPDNRRPVDFALRDRLLGELEARAAAAGQSDDLVQALVAELLAHAEDGRIKLWTIWRALQMRRRRPALFVRGDYVPLQARGPNAAHLLTFGRQTETDAAIVAVPRLTARLPGPLADAFADTELPLPATFGHGRWRCALSGGWVEVRNGSASVSSLFRHFPGALLFPAG